MYSNGPLHMTEQKQDDQLEHTYSSYVRIRDVALKTCQRRWTIERSGERGSGISVLAARHHDDDEQKKFNQRIWKGLNSCSNSQKCLVAYCKTSTHFFTFIHLFVSLSLSRSLSLSLSLSLVFLLFRSYIDTRACVSFRTFNNTKQQCIISCFFWSLCLGVVYRKAFWVKKILFLLLSF